MEFPCFSAVHRVDVAPDGLRQCDEEILHDECVPISEYSKRRDAKCGLPFFFFKAAIRMFPGPCSMPPSQQQTKRRSSLDPGILSEIFTNRRHNVTAHSPLRAVSTTFNR